MSAYQEPDDARAPAPARLGRYELLGLLATGGMGEIHLARLADGPTSGTLVVKRLLPELVSSPAYVQMFMREARLAARIQHPNVCEVFELGRDGAEYYLAMPYLDGVPATELIARPREADRGAQLRVATGVITQACAGLHHAHELRDEDGAPAGLVHRDVSPANLFVTTDGVVKLLDFGVAKIHEPGAATAAGMIKGTWPYMSPEQVAGDDLDRRSDVFALGVVLFELATHQRLFHRPSEFLTAKAILEEPVPRADAVDPAVPAALADVVARALARDRTARWPDAAAMATAVTAAMAAHGGVGDARAIAETLATLHADAVTARHTRRADLVAAAPATRFDLATVRGPQASGPRRRTGLVAAFGGLAALAAVIGLGGLGAVWGLRRFGGEGAAESPSAPVDAAPRVARADALAPDAVAPAPPDGAVPPEIDMPPAPVPRPAPPAAPGTIGIDSTPYATIYVDGRALGVTPILHAALPAGRHVVRAVLADGRAREVPIVVPAGRAAPPLRLSW